MVISAPMGPTHTGIIRVEKVTLGTRQSCLLMMDVIRAHPVVIAIKNILKSPLVSVVKGITVLTKQFIQHQIIQPKVVGLVHQGTFVDLDSHNRKPVRKVPTAHTGNSHVFPSAICATVESIVELLVCPLPTGHVIRDTIAVVMPQYQTLKASRLEMCAPRDTIALTVPQHRLRVLQGRSTTARWVPDRKIVSRALVVCIVKATGTMCRTVSVIRGTSVSEVPTLRDPWHLISHIMGTTDSHVLSILSIRQERYAGQEHIVPKEVLLHRSVILESFVGKTDLTRHQEIVQQGTSVNKVPLYQTPWSAPQVDIVRLERM